MRYLGAVQTVGTEWSLRRASNSSAQQRMQCRTQPSPTRPFNSGALPKETSCNSSTTSRIHVMQLKHHFKDSRYATPTPLLGFMPCDLSNHLRSDVRLEHTHMETHPTRPTYDLDALPGRSTSKPLEHTPGRDVILLDRHATWTRSHEEAPRSTRPPRLEEMTFHSTDHARHPTRATRLARFRRFLNRLFILSFYVLGFYMFCYKYSLKSLPKRYGYYHKVYE
ncbi:PREDICTED: uncharacterized protein LOC104724983 [Camelina sativa]|uniref:Uncharacterized protein LOC104724983 n=1 Tax=Camelina sativa TaxID=90675 RepID=A0ABM0UJ16_CAMSA|nr:PREDICTED: uncharacterized protein LOC104724983 [Camelina sativa]